MTGIKDPVVSIIMPVYNAEKYISESISDICAQAFSDFEIICVDDGSVDGSGKLLDSYAAEESRIRVIHQENKGGGIARYVGLMEAVGKYVIFLDADDRYETELIGTVVDQAEMTGSDVVAFNADQFDDVSKKVMSAPWLILKSEQEIAGNPFDILNTTIWNKLFLRSFIIDNHISFIDNRYSDTMYFVAVALLYSRRTSIVNKVLLHYRINNEHSLIANQDKDYGAAYKNLERIREDVSKIGRKEAWDAYFRLSERVLVDRLRMMRSRESYFALYNMLHDGGIANLGFDEERFSDSKEGRRLREIFERGIAEDLFEYRKSLLESGIVNAETFGLPSLEAANGKCRIVLYGAGNVGRDYFRLIMNRPDLSLCAWVDKKYERIGFPVTAPESIQNLEYDIVLIALNDEKNVSAIADDLEKLGVDRNRVVWKEPVIIST